MERGEKGRRTLGDAGEGAGGKERVTHLYCLGWLIDENARETPGRSCYRLLQAHGGVEPAAGAGAGAEAEAEPPATALTERTSFDGPY